MRDYIIIEDLQFRYTLIVLYSINYKIFLKSDTTEEKILAILANFEKDKPLTAIANILKEVKATAKGSLQKVKFQAIPGFSAITQFRKTI